MNIDKDYYKALGVSKDASADEIRTTYRKLAKTLHPDRNPGDAKAEERFKEVSEAYDVLSDKDKRREYDEQRSLLGSGFRMPGGASGRGAGPGFSVNLDDLFGARAGGAGGRGFGDIFGDLFNRGGRPTTEGPRRGRDVEGEVTVDFEEAFTGGVVALSVTSPHTCPTCAGLGSAPGTSPRTCPVCNGVGLTSRDQGTFSFSEPCRECRGQGKIVDTPCPECAGEGLVVGTRTVNVRIPKGVRDGQRIRVKGKGSAGANGGPAGDLHVLVHVRPHPLFGRRGDDLTLSLPITFPEAALGKLVTVPTLDRPVTLRIPAGTSSGRTLRVRGRGVERGGRTGDLLVTVNVVVPSKLSKEGKNALAAFAKAQPQDPRPEITEAVDRAEVEGQADMS